MSYLARILLHLQVKGDIYFGAVTDEEVSRWFISNKTIDRTPAFLLVDDTGAFHTANAEDFYDEPAGMRDWILRQSVPAVGL